MRTTLLVLHIIGAAVWLGANITQAVVSPGFVRAGGETAARWWATTVQMGKVLYPPAAATVLITGVVMVLTSDYRFSDWFVIVGLAMVVIGGVLGARVFGPRGEQAAALRSAGDDAAALVQEAALRRTGTLDTVLLVLTVVAMVTRWGV